MSQNNLQYTVERIQDLPPPPTDSPFPKRGTSFRKEVFSDCPSRHFDYDNDQEEDSGQIGAKKKKKILLEALTGTFVKTKEVIYTSFFTPPFVTTLSVKITLGGLLY